MRGDDEIPHGEGEAPECAGTCLAKLRSELHDATPDQVLHELQHYCESQALVDYCTLHGVNGATFSWNPHLHCRRRLFRRRHSHLHQQFWKAYQDNPSLNIALAFHGTAETNVRKILHHGMDPQFRRTQAFGKGEYYSKEPGLSATYRHEGHCLLVFALLMPKDHEKVYSQKDRDIIVMTDLSHQLPLGVLKFEDVDEAKIQHSQDMRLVQRGLKQKAIELDWCVAEAKLEAELATLLQKHQWEQASTVLTQATRYHKVSSEQEQRLANLICQTVPDTATRERFFPSFASIEPQVSDTPRPSLAELEAQTEEAWRAFVAMKMDPLRNIMVGVVKTTTCAQQIQKQQLQPGTIVALEQ